MLSQPYHPPAFFFLSWCIRWFLFLENLILWKSIIYIIGVRSGGETEKIKDLTRSLYLEMTKFIPWGWTCWPKGFKGPCVSSCLSSLESVAWKHSTTISKEKIKTNLTWFFVLMEAVEGSRVLLPTWILAADNKTKWTV